ncbi:MAG TPA: peptidoglycan DD-metalloendopeptidase family protein [Caulobacteraceae bacterium]|jgi:murein DD-endopeptidase MepM/ murein hydrolase activator NlpD|nr:peptidoglycan DD-metalloendopeptidase family protein [Caulobacteraceae bacterium]
MTALHGRAAFAVLMASVLSACAMDGPRYPTHETAEAQTAPAPAAAPAPQPAATAASPTPRSQPAPVTPGYQPVQSAQLPPAAGAASSGAPSSDSEPAPITEAPTNSSIAPPVNRRPGNESTAALTPPPVESRASRRRAQAAPQLVSAPAPRPLVAGRVENVSDTSHVVDVEKGDTVNSISQGLMTPKDALIKANKLHKPYELEVGRSLKIPVHKVYVVQSGDTLYGIARRFSAPVDVLSDLNRIEAKARLRPGQKIALPQLAKDTGPLPGHPSMEMARAERTTPQRETVMADETPTESRAAEVDTPAPPSRPDPYSPPSTPRPYASLSPSPPLRSYYPTTPPARPAYTPTTPETAPAVSDQQIQVAGRGRFIWPVKGDVLSNFGPKPGGQRNDGVDIAAPARSAVHAAASGDVVYAGDQIPGFGNLVLIKHEGGWVTAYAHLASSEVRIREHVSQGTEIGQVGQTGGVDQPQLHFEIRYAPSPRDKARPVDPNLLLSSLSDQ